MKMPSLALESKVLLTAVGICILGILRMTHIVHFSETDDVCLLFLLGTVLSGLCFRSSSHYSAVQAVTALSSGLLLWTAMGPATSMFDACFKGIIVACFGLVLVLSLLSMLKDFRNANRKEIPDMHLEN
ncbi:MAG: hypothetical protein WBQ94_00045 [Terracidiphilus sp.]